MSREFSDDFALLSLCVLATSEVPSSWRCNNTGRVNFDIGKDHALPRTVNFACKCIPEQGIESQATGFGCNGSYLLVLQMGGLCCASFCCG